MCYRISFKTKIRHALLSNEEEKQEGVDAHNIAQQAMIMIYYCAKQDY
jgi:hypothetical protein